MLRWRKRFVAPGRSVGRLRAAAFAQRRRQYGFSLIEVLIAVVVLSIGLLGVAGLQLFSLKSVKAAELADQASLRAYDMSERMRANRVAFEKDVFATVQGQKISSCMRVAGCNTTDMAKNDLFEWNRANSRRLPGGKGVVCLDSTPRDGSYNNAECDGAGQKYAIKLWWIDKSMKGSDYQRYVAVFSP